MLSECVASAALLKTLRLSSARWVKGLIWEGVRGRRLMVRPFAGVRGGSMSSIRGLQSGAFNSGSSIRGLQDFGPGVKKAADFKFYLLSRVFKSEVFKSSVGLKLSLQAASNF